MEENIFALKKIVTIYLNPITIGLEFIVLGGGNARILAEEAEKRTQTVVEKSKTRGGRPGDFHGDFRSVFHLHVQHSARLGFIAVCVGERTRSAG